MKYQSIKFDMKKLRVYRKYPEFEASDDTLREFSAWSMCSFPPRV
jgi:hypothetical protein